MTDCVDFMISWQLKEVGIYLQSAPTSQSDASSIQTGMKVARGQMIGKTFLMTVLGPYEL